MTDQYINDLLKEVYESKTYKRKAAVEFSGNTVLYLEYFDTFVGKMVNELGLVIKVSGDKWALSEKGLRISKNGGWLKHLEAEKEKERRASRKENWDYYYSKFRFFTYWIIFGFSVIAFGLSIYNFIKTLQPPKIEENTKDLKNPNSQKEMEATKLHTSSSTPQISDSLQSSNHQNNPSQIELQKDSL